MSTQRVTRKLETLKSTKLLINMRRNGMSTPRTMVLSAVRDGTAKYGSVFIGEVHALYHSNGAAEGTKPYGYSGISSMLRTLEKEGLVTKTKDGQYAKYSTNAAGVALLRNMGV